MNKHHRSRTTILCIILLNLSFVLQFQSPVGASVSAPTYTITDLGTLPPLVSGGTAKSGANAINNNGEVVGTSFTLDGTGEIPQAFLWTVSGGMIGLPSEAKAATDINDSGQVVGNAFIVKEPGTYSYAFLWSASSGIIDLGQGACGNQPWSCALTGLETAATDINNVGEVVGWAPASGGQRAFLWRPVLGLIDLGTLPGGSGNYIARGINNQSQVVGDGGGGEIFLWQDGVMQELTPGTIGVSSDINDAGQVVGLDVTNARTFVWQNGVKSYLCLPANSVQAGGNRINASGDVVGSASFPGTTPKAQLWVLAADRFDSTLNCYTPVNLNDLIPQDSGWTLTQANDINDVGQIVGTGIINGQVHAFLLTPVATATFTISGNVWVDTNRNGAKDSGENPYQGATVTLSGVALKTQTTDASGNYAFTGLLAGNYTVVLTVPDGYEATTLKSRQVVLPPSTTVNFGIARGRVIIFIQGQGSSLDTSLLPGGFEGLDGAFSQANGLQEYLQGNGWPITSFLEYSYNEGRVDTATGRWLPNAYGCADTFSHTLTADVSTLANQVTAYLQAHPNTDVYLIGYSQGGTIALGYVALLKAQNWSLPNAGQLAGVVSLDSPLGGIPAYPLVRLPFQQVLRVKTCLPQSIRAFTNLDGLEAIYKTGAGEPIGGTRSVAEALVGLPGISNQSLAQEAAQHQVRVLAVGNRRDYLFAPCKPPNIPTFISTQWLSDDGDTATVYTRIISRGELCDPTVDIITALQLIKTQHNCVLIDSYVQGAVKLFLTGIVPPGNPVPSATPCK